MVTAGFVVVVTVGLVVVGAGGGVAGGRHAASVSAPTATVASSSSPRRMWWYRHPDRESLKRRRRPGVAPTMSGRCHPLLGSIPSPSSGNLGPFHMYGIILAVGVLVGVYVAEHRWRRRGYPKDGIYDISFWVVIWGVIGARVYHVITDYQLLRRRPDARVPDLARRPLDLGRGDRRRDAP